MAATKGIYSKQQGGSIIIPLMGSGLYTHIFHS